MEVEIVYLSDDVNSELNADSYASIDLGLDNLVTMVTDFSEPIIYSGKQIKSKNQYFNKRISKLKSTLAHDNGKRTSKQIQRLYASRDGALSDIYHKVSRHIVNTLLRNKVGNLIIGHNNGWKDSINIGKVNNQNFVYVAFDKLISMLTYKCNMVGITVTVTEESYTSKCDALCSEDICFHKSYSGRRIRRGLFSSGCGKLINADVNGALNIMRKVVGESEIVSRIIDSGRLFRPIKYNNVYNMDNVVVYK